MGPQVVKKRMADLTRKEILDLADHKRRYEATQRMREEMNEELQALGGEKLPDPEMSSEKSGRPAPGTGFGADFYKVLYPPVLPDDWVDPFSMSQNSDSSTPAASKPATSSKSSKSSKSSNSSTRQAAADSGVETNENNRFFVTEMEKLEDESLRREIFRNASGQDKARDNGLQFSTGSSGTKKVPMRLLEEAPNGNTNLVQRKLNKIQVVCGAKRVIKTATGLKRDKQMTKKIKEYQLRPQGNMIAASQFRALIRDCAESMGFGGQNGIPAKKWSVSALQMLQKIMEEMLVTRLSTCCLLASHGRRVTLKDVDLVLLKRLKVSIRKDIRLRAEL